MPNPGVRRRHHLRVTVTFHDPVTKKQAGTILADVIKEGECTISNHLAYLQGQYPETDIYPDFLDITIKD